MAIGTRTTSSQQRWLKRSIGIVLLWRACATMLVGSTDLADDRLLAAWSNPGLHRAAKLAFATHSGDHGENAVDRGAPAASAGAPSTQCQYGFVP